MKSRLAFPVVAFITALAAANPAGAATPNPSPEPAGATLIVLDASGSMRERIKGETKMEIAQRAVRELLESLPESARLGLVVYSHRKLNDCADIELLITPGKLDKAAFVAAVDAIKPNGRTPLSAAVEFAASALDYTKQPAGVILVSDGLETCGKDPCATVAKLEAAGKALTIHAVAFDLSAKEAKAIDCIASVTGGRFLQANDAASLKDALHVAVAETAAAAAPTPPPPEVLTAATLSAPKNVGAGAVFPVEWTGPDNPGDTITIVPKGTPDDQYANFTYTRQGSPLPITALIEPGETELRYLTSRSRTVLARAPITITPNEVTLSAADQTTAGAKVAITWTGPANHGDYITIVPKTAEDGAYAKYENASIGSPVSIAAPMTTGEGEIRYMSGQGRRVLARRPIAIVAAEVTLAAPDQAVAGSKVAIEWTGPDNQGDYITIVAKSAADGTYAKYENTRIGSPLSIAAPMTTGEGEIRYMSGQGGRVLARRPIAIVAAEVTLKAPDEAVAGSSVAVEWTGPDNQGDYITIVPKATRDDGYAGYANTRVGSPARIVAPTSAGDGEVRYVAGQGKQVLARIPIRIVDAEVAVAAVDTVVAGAEVAVTWSGPNNNGDYITIVMKGTPDSGYAGYKNTSLGSPVKVVSPITPGEGEIRYVSGPGRKVLARRAISFTAPQIKLEAPSRAAVGSLVSIVWTGPNNNGDFLTIVPKGTPDGQSQRHAPTSRGSPATVNAPAAAGPGEVRYMSGQGNKVLARRDIEITAAGP